MTNDSKMNLSLHLMNHIIVMSNEQKVLDFNKYVDAILNECQVYQQFKCLRQSILQYSICFKTKNESFTFKSISSDSFTVVFERNLEYNGIKCIVTGKLISGKKSTFITSIYDQKRKLLKNKIKSNNEKEDFLKCYRTSIRVFLRILERVFDMYGKETIKKGFLNHSYSWFSPNTWKLKRKGILKLVIGKRDFQKLFHNLVNHNVNINPCFRNY